MFDANVRTNYADVFVFADSGRWNEQGRISLYRRKFSMWRLIHVFP